MSAPADNSAVFLPGPWQHRLVNANGCQFHIAYMGEHRNARSPRPRIPGILVDVAPPDRSRRSRRL